MSLVCLSLYFVKTIRLVKKNHESMDWLFGISGGEQLNVQQCTQRLSQAITLPKIRKFTTF